MSTDTAPAATGPVSVRDYVETGHLQFEMRAADGHVLAHRYQHVVTGVHYVRDYEGSGRFAEPVYSGPDEIQARKAWVALYRRYSG